MTRILTVAEIAMPIERVFEFVTTPANWPRWHPAMQRVAGATDHPLQAGEQVEAMVRMVGRRLHTLWLVREHVAPRRWMIESIAVGGGRATIAYSLVPAGDGSTRLEREIVYAAPGRLWETLDRLILRRHMEAQSRRALGRLKAVLESERQEAFGAAAPLRRATMLRLAGALVASFAFLPTLQGSAQAGEADEVATTMERWARAFNAGDAEAVAALYAPDARMFGILSAGRLDGRERIRAYFAEGLQAKPQVRFGPNPAIRIYAERAAVDTGDYEYVATIDGQERHFPARYSVTLVRDGEGWRIVDHHSSLVPAAPTP